MSKIKTLDWQTSRAPQAGRIAQISDEGCGYWAALPDDMTLRDAADSFGLGYDYNGYIGEISCDAQMLVSGEEIESLRFTLDSRRYDCGEISRDGAAWVEELRRSAAETRFPSIDPSKMTSEDRDTLVAYLRGDNGRLAEFSHRIAGEIEALHCKIGSP